MWALGTHSPISQALGAALACLDRAVPAGQVSFLDKSNRYSDQSYWPTLEWYKASNWTSSVMQRACLPAREPVLARLQDPSSRKRGPGPPDWGARGDIASSRTLVIVSSLDQKVHRNSAAPCSCPPCPQVRPLGPGWDTRAAFEVAWGSCSAASFCR